MTTEETIIRNIASLLTLPQLQEQGLDVLVYGTCPDALTLTPKQELQLKVQMGKYLRQHLRLNQDLATVFTHLQANGLHPVLLKGQGCATYYPNPVLRATGDLDIWIGKEDYERAKTVVINLCGTDEAEENGKHLEIKYGETVLEIHRIAESLIHPTHKSFFEKYSTEQLNNPQQVSLNGTCFEIPGKQFQALHVFMHLWHHFSIRGISLRQFVDLAMILHKHHQSINLTELEEALQKLGRMKAWQMIGCVLVDEFGLPPQEYPFYSTKYRRQAKAILTLTLYEGNFGQKINYGNTKSSLFKFAPIVTIR